MTTFAEVVSHGQVTHVLVPIEDFRRLSGAEDAMRSPSALQSGQPSAATLERALSILDDPATQWHDADALVLGVLREGIASARKSAGLTQDDVARELGLSQAQVSRIESSPDSATLRVLKRIAEILAQRRGC